MQTETESWRVEVVQLITGGAGFLTTIEAGERAITIAQYDSIRWAGHRAHVHGDDAALMQSLTTYCPRGCCESRVAGRASNV